MNYKSYTDLFILIRIQINDCQHHKVKSRTVLIKNSILECISVHIYLFFLYIQWYFGTSIVYNERCLFTNQIVSRVQKKLKV